MSIIPPKSPMSQKYFKFDKWEWNPDEVKIQLEITYMGKVYRINDYFPIESYRQSAIDHDYMNMEKHMIRMLRALVTGEARPIHPRYPELEEVGRKLIQGGK